MDLAPKKPRVKAAVLRTVLVVDDNPSVLKFVSSFLAREYRVLTAANGKQALEQSKAFKAEIHLLLSDLQMPEMTGIELATELTLHRPKIKVLLMSGFPGGGLVLNEGWHFLSKPFIPSQLSELVKGLIFPKPKSKFQA
jgi:CheY-like chemotaxis protein